MTPFEFQEKAGDIWPVIVNLAYEAEVIINKFLDKQGKFYLGDEDIEDGSGCFILDDVCVKAFWRDSKGNIKVELTNGSDATKKWVESLSHLAYSQRICIAQYVADVVED